MAKKTSKVKEAFKKSGIPELASTVTKGVRPVRPTIFGSGFTTKKLKKGRSISFF